jgi:hypothetical protein
MDDNEKDAILAIDDVFASQITPEEAQALQPILKKFVESYFNRDSMPIDAWLRAELAESLPDRSAEEIAQMSDEIIDTLHVQEEKKASLEKAVANGRSKESWFASEAETATSYMSTQEASQYLQGLDEAVNFANESLQRTIHTKAGAISQNPNLDGFIAEQYHVQTFNLNAEATGSPYRAKVLEPDGSGYAKNSPDIVILDGDGKIVRRYQAKYYKDAEATTRAFEQGDYRGQRKLVPDGQEQDIPTKVSTVLEAPDGTTSNRLSKERAKELQTEAQSGNWNDLNWNEYQTKALATRIGKETGQAALLGAAVGVGFDIAQKAWNGEKIEGEELVETALVSGADLGVKTAAAGALKVCVEKDMIAALPKGTPASTITDIAHIAIENVKIIGKVATGKLTAREGLEKMEQTTVAAVSGIVACANGTEIGAAVGTVLGPIGTAVGGFIGGTVGYMAGSKVGETVVEYAKKIREKAGEAVKAVTQTVSNVVSSAWNGIKSFLPWG